jgi:hypothetical protein
VEVRWRSLFRSTSLGKRCTSYKALPHFSKTCCRPFAAGFGKIVEQALPLWGSSFTFVSPSLKRFYHLKTAARLIASSPQSWGMNYMVSEFIAQRWRSTKEISSCSTILKRVLIKRQLQGWRSCHYYVNPTITTWHNTHRLPLHNSGALPPVHELFKRPSYLHFNHIFVIFFSIFKEMPDGNLLQIIHDRFLPNVSLVFILTCNVTVHNPRGCLSY